MGKGGERESGISGCRNLAPEARRRFLYGKDNASLLEVQS